MTKIPTWMAAAVLAAGALAAKPAFAVKHISMDVKVPASVAARLYSDGDCSNKGNVIRLDGTLESDPLPADIVLTNNRRWRHVAGPFDATAVVTLSEFAQTEFHKQGSLEDGVGGNPWIGVAASLADDPTLLGRCVQGLDSDVALDFLLDGRLELDVTSDGCDQQGPTVTLDGTLVLGGAAVHVFLQNKRTEPTHWAETDARLGLEVEPERTVDVRKSPHFGGAGGNPYVWVRVGSGSWLNLGRCNKI